MTEVECGSCGTRFDPNRDARGSSERCPYCGTKADVDEAGAGEAGAAGSTEEIVAPAGATVRITIEIVRE